MAGANASEIRVAGTGRVFVAAAGTAPPADFTKDWTDPWRDLGYTSADGVKFTKKDKLDPVDTWQTVAAIRYVYSDRDLSVKFALLQVNADTLPFFFGGGVMQPGGLSYQIAAAPQVVERSLGVEFRDGPTVTHRFYVPRGVVTDTDETAFSRNTAVRLGVTFTALTPISATSEPLAVWSMNATAPTAAATAATAEEE
ncbi:MAG: hypothetical protein ACJ73S_05050 [Mycobacteriales bacterium]